MSRLSIYAVIGLFFCFSVSIAPAQSASSGAIRGTVKLAPGGLPARNALVSIVELGQSTLTDANGVFVFEKVSAGRYQIMAHLDRVPDLLKTITTTGADQTVDFELMLAPVSEQVIVTASGGAEALGSSYQPAAAVSALELSQKNPISLGEALEYQTGVAKRSFGPASGRPIIRGFDGDRVLVLQDGLRLGSIASQSADEVEPMDVLNLDRVEIVRGPATLLYGSNAIGGVVNGISTNDVYQQGQSGYLTAFGGTNGRQAGASGGLKLGVNKFSFFGSASGQRANDYRSGSGTVLNSYARAGAANVGAGWFPRKGWLIFNYSHDRRRHGIPTGRGEIDLEYLKERRHSFEAKAGLRNLTGFVEAGDFGIRYNNYNASEFEFESDENLTELKSIATNRNLNYRANFSQRRRGNYSGTFGISGFTRDFLSVGEEAPAPHTKQNSVAVYALQRIDLERVGFQFGGRIEQNGYKPEGNFRRRNFVGFSGSVGARIPLWTGGSVAANYQHSFRAPALEELYNNGPHPGIRTFDIGNPDLNAEQGDGIDLTLRHNGGRFRLETGAYYYNIRNFVFTAFTGQTDAASHLPIIRYEQATSRFAGAEANAEARLISDLWLNGKFDYVRADLTELNQPLPRIPPLRGTIGLDWRHSGWSVRPEVVLVNKQTRLFDNETPTAGYALVHLNGSYTFVTHRVAHIISLHGSNLTDKLYRNHLSFLKAIAPEMGRSVRLSYMLRF